MSNLPEVRNTSATIRIFNQSLIQSLCFQPLCSNLLDYLNLILIAIHEGRCYPHFISAEETETWNLNNLLKVSHTW